MAASPNFVNLPNVGQTRFLNADGTGAKTLFTAGAAGSRIHQIFVTSDESSDKQMTISIKQGGVAFILDRFTVYSGISTRPVSYYNVLDPDRLTHLDPNEPAVILMSGQTIEANMEATVTSGKVVNVFVVGGDF